MAATDTAFDLREYLAIARRRLWLWVLPTVLITASALAISFLLTPKYRTSTTVLISDPEWLSASVQRFVPQSQSGYNPYDRGRQAALIQNEIRSSYTLGLLIDALDLDADPKVQKEVAELWKERSYASVEQLTRQYVAAELLKKIQVYVQGTNLVQVRVTDKDPQLAARMSDKLAEIFMDQRRKRELAGIRSALDFTDEQLEVYRQKQADAEERLRQFQKQSLSTSFDENLLNQTNVSAIIAELDASKFDLEQLRDRQKELSARIESYGADPAKWTTSREVSRLEQTFLLQVSDYVKLLGRYTWKDPTVVALNTRLASSLDEIESSIRDEVADRLPADDPHLQRLWGDYLFQRVREDFLTKKIGVLDQSIQQLKARNAKGPDYEITLQNLKNEVEYNRRIYQSFLDQLTGSQIQQALQEAEAENRFRVLEPAVVPFDPVFPDHLRIALLGLVLGVLVGAALVVGFELSDHSFRKPEQVEEYLGLTVLGSVPRLTRGGIRT